MVPGAGVHVQGCTERSLVAEVHVQGCMRKSLVLGCMCRGAQRHPWCWGAHAGVHREILGVGVHMYMRRSLVQQGMRRRSMVADVHIQRCMRRYLVERWMCRRSLVGEVNMQGCMRRCLVQGVYVEEVPGYRGARAGMHKEIRGVGMHVQGCVRRSLVQRWTCKAA